MIQLRRRGPIFKARRRGAPNGPLYAIKTVGDDLDVYNDAWERILIDTQGNSHPNVIGSKK